ncbi:MAG: hypothetical protein H7836_04125 [Magnetococcus sp. YQC-3]
MSDRVRAYRERQKAAGLSQVTLWLDAPTVALLKRAAEIQQKQPGEVVSLALNSWWESQDQPRPVPTKKADLEPEPTPPPPVLPDPELLRSLVQQMVQEALAAARPTQPPTQQDPLPRPSLYKWPISL